MHILNWIYRGDNILSEKVNQALKVAAFAHRGQTRKGNPDLPYIVHPVETAMYLLKAGEKSELIVAALLHDTLEDTDLTPEEIENKFGQEILYLVLKVSENLENRDETTWEKRKKQFIKKIKPAEKNVKKIVTADKLSNVKSMLQEYNEKGNQIWNNFNRGYEKQKSHYFELKQALSTLQGYSLYDLFAEKVKILFSSGR